MQIDGKIRLLAQLCGPAATEEDLVLVARLVELTEFPAGSIAATAGVPGRWCTRVLAGSITTTVPAALHSEGAVLVHGPETAVLAATDVVLLTAAERDLAAVDALAPGLVRPSRRRAQAGPRPYDVRALPARAVGRAAG